MKSKKLFKYELLNVLRNKWIIFYGALLFIFSLALIWIGGSYSKAILSIANLIVVLIPLVSLMFTVVYWYYNESYTEMLVTQPLSRSSIFVSRWLAISLTHSSAIFIGLILPFIIYWALSFGVIINIFIGLVLCWIFTGIGSLIALFFKDRMKGFGFALSFWLFLVLIYDGLILTLLLVLKDYPLDMLSGILGVLNPIGLSRVLLLIYHDGSLLLGYTGVLVQKIILSKTGFVLGLSIMVTWLMLPFYITYKKINRRDF